MSYISKYTVYALAKSRTGNIFYVGITTNTKVRFNAHRCKYGKRVKCIILEESEDMYFRATISCSGRAAEGYWMNLMISMGHKLINKQLPKPNWFWYYNNPNGLGPKDRVIKAAA